MIHHVRYHPTEALVLAIDLSAKTCLITGATSGIGLVAALELARMGAHVALAGRSPERLRAAEQRIAEQVGEGRTETLLCDFARLSCVHELSAEFLGRHERLDVLVNNAGLIVGERVLTEDGNELTFQVDHLSHFLLTNLLLGVLRAAPSARVVTVASEAHQSARHGIDLDDLTRNTHYDPYAVYSEAKLANVMFAYELARRLEGTHVTSNAVHPGAVRTNWGTGSWGVAGVAWNLIRPFLRTPEEGARTTTYVASEPELEHVTGKYFVDSKAVRSSRQSYRLDAARMLWAVSEHLTGLAPWSDRVPPASVGVAR